MFLENNSGLGGKIQHMEWNEGRNSY